MTFRESLVKVPIIGGLAYCTGSDFIKTLEEIVPKFTIAILPIIFSTIFLRFVGDRHLNLPEAFTKNFENGELFLFCTSMLSSIFYIAVRDRASDKPGFPNRTTHLLFVTTAIGFSSFIYGLKRSGANVDPELLINSSYGFFLVSFLMVLLATTINNGLNNNPIRFQLEETDNFVDQLNNHRGK